MGEMFKSDKEYIQKYLDFLRCDPQIPPEAEEMCAFSLTACLDSFVGIEIFRLLDVKEEKSEGSGLYIHSAKWGVKGDTLKPILSKVARGDSSHVLFIEIGLEESNISDKVLQLFEDNMSSSLDMLRRLGILIDFTVLSEENYNKLKGVSACLHL